MPHKRLKEMVASAALLALLAGQSGGCGNQEPQPVVETGGEETAPSRGTTVLGKAGEVEVTPEQYRIYLHETSRRKPEDLSFEERKRALQRCLVRLSLAVEGKRLGGEDDDLMQKALAIWKLRHYPDFYFPSQVFSRVEATDEELREFINPQEMHQLGAIVLPLSEEGREEAEEILKLLTEGGDFAEMARERSHGRLASRGGDMDWQVIPNIYVDETVTEAIRLLSPGEYTQPMETSIGWIIYQLRDYVSAEEEFQNQREAKLPRLLGQKKGEAKKKKMAELREQAEIVIHPPEKVAEGAPFAVVGGVSIMPEIVDSLKHGGGNAVFTIEERLYQYIDALVVVLEVERLGLDKEEPLASRFDYVRTRQLSEFAVERAVMEKLDLTEEQLMAEYQRAYQPEVYQLQIVKTEEKDTAEKALAELEEGRDFGEVAASYSEGDLGKKQGMLPERNISSLPPALGVEIQGLADGERTGIIEGEDVNGYLIVKRISMRTLEVPPYEKVKEKVRERLTLKQRSTVVKEYMKDFSGSLAIEIDEDLLRSL